MSPISSYLLAFCLTVAIELTVAYLFNFRKKLEIITIISVNLLTQPALNYLVFINNYFSFIKLNILIILLLELVVVLVEWKLMAYALPNKSKQLLILSFVMNLSSYISGLFIF